MRGRRSPPTPLALLRPCPCPFPRPRPRPFAVPVPAPVPAPTGAASGLRIANFATERSTPRGPEASTATVRPPMRCTEAIAATVTSPVHGPEALTAAAGARVRCRDAIAAPARAPADCQKALAATAGPPLRGTRVNRSGRDRLRTIHGDLAAAVIASVQSIPALAADDGSRLASHPRPCSETRRVSSRRPRARCGRTPLRWHGPRDSAARIGPPTRNEGDHPVAIALVGCALCGRRYSKMSSEPSSSTSGGNSRSASMSPFRRARRMRGKQDSATSRPAARSMSM